MQTKIWYTNYKGETSERTIIPGKLWYGSTHWHPQTQWFIRALDVNKQEDRDFALIDFGHKPHSDNAPASPSPGLGEKP